MPGKLGIGIIALAAFASGLSAASITYRVTSSFPVGIPPTALSGPGALFTLSFILDLPIVVGPGSLPGGFTTTPSNVSLGFSSNTIALLGNSIEFFSAGQGGGFFLDATDGVDFISFSFIAPQLFGGDPAAPQFLTGQFLADPTDAFTFIQLGGSAGPVYSPVGDTTIFASVPEPGTCRLVAIGHLAAVGVRRRVRRRLGRRD